MALPEAVLSAKKCASIPGWEFDVICARPFKPWMGHDPSLDDYVRRNFGRIERLEPGLAARFLSTQRLPALTQRPDPMAFLNRRALNLARRWLGSRPYRAVLTWSTWHSIHLVGRRLRRTGGPPWIAHFSDPWSENPYVRQSRLTRAVNRRLERSVLEAADRLLYTSSETVDLVAETFGEAYRAKSVVVPHNADPELFPATGMPAARERVIARYLGRFYGPRTPEPLFAGLAELVRTDPLIADRLAVELIGEMAPGMLTTPEAQSLPAGLVRVLPPVDYVPSLRLASDADFLIVVDAKTTRNVFLPSKLVDYLGAGRPIVAISPSGPTRRVVEEAGGRVVQPGDPVAIGQALAAATTEAFAVERVARELPERFTSTAVGAQMAQVFEEVI